MFTMAPLNAQQTTKVSVDPAVIQINNAYVGQRITININVSNVQHLWAWALKDIHFNPVVLNLSSVMEGSFLNSSGSMTFFTWSSSSRDKITNGTIPEIVGAIAEDASISGSGVIATLTFNVLSVGNSDINLGSVELMDNAGNLSHDRITVTSTNGVIRLSSSSSSTPIMSGSSPVPSGTSPTPTSTSATDFPTTTPAGQTTNPPVGAPLGGDGSYLLLFIGIIVIVAVVVGATIIIVRRRKS